MKKVGIITIGQAPRKDLFPEVERFFSDEVAFIQRGVLDDVSNDRLASLKPGLNETTLVSKKRDGMPAVMAKEKIIPIVQAIISQLNKDGIDLIILACTGAFKPFSSQAPIIYPDHLLNHVAQGLFKTQGDMGVIIPLKEQEESIKQKWSQAGFQAVCATCSPYDFSEQALVKAVLQLEHTNVQAIVLDCIGYTKAMKELVRKHTTKPVVLSRNIVFQNAAEIV
ncbi:AroM family protein [Amphibacillus cookii]|uniref:AroM family protein n=1 Tax=Amphibacillus cookii TaxID=767787 RepID=UPI00195ACCC6|nr:AroM family protein [Amphibacillus cookii]MBM7542770.1 protein AroM [Amphibacillus cookii]